MRLPEPNAAAPTYNQNILIAEPTQPLINITESSQPQSSAVHGAAPVSSTRPSAIDNNHSAFQAYANSMNALLLPPQPTMPPNYNMPPDIYYPHPSAYMPTHMGNLTMANATLNIAQSASMEQQLGAVGGIKSDANENINWNLPGMQFLEHQMSGAFMSNVGLTSFASNQSMRPMHLSQQIHSPMQIQQHQQPLQQAYSYEHSQRNEQTMNVNNFSNIL